MKIIDRKKFSRAALDKYVKTFVVHITFLLTIAIYPARKALIALLIAKQIQILTQYSNFLDVFLEEKALILLAAINLNKYDIKLQKDQQLPYKLIYSLGLIELKTLKIYIEINLANGFI